MIHPIRRARTKYYEHRGKICVGAGFAAGVAVTVYCLKPALPDHLGIDTVQTAEEIATMIKNAKAIDVTNPQTGKMITIFASDYIE